MEDETPSSIILVDPQKLRVDIALCQSSMDHIESGATMTVNGPKISEDRYAIYMSFASRKITLEQILEGAYS